jgi:uncharacterized protein (DUF1501 family)
MLTRRDLLRASLASGVGWLVRDGVTAAVVDRGAAPATDDPVLVLVELTGGNDGLNTLVPFADDRYHRARPALRHRAETVHRIDDALGYAPALARLAALHKEGLIRVQLGVGMTRPDRSHFESLDRWHTGDPAPGARAEGWLGRSLDLLAPKDAAFPAVALGDRALPRVLAGGGRAGVACEALSELSPSARTRRLLRSPRFGALLAARGSEDDRRLEASARAFADGLESLLRRDLGAERIPANDLGRKLGDAYRLATGPFRVPAVFVRTGGFDTHARQDQVHAGLLSDVDAALAAFVRALGAAGKLDRTLVVVYSEFGRRVAENGSRGTDHGSAGPALLMGGGVAPGVFGDRPDLASLDDGDVRATTDFRRVIATALAHLGHPRPADVLGPEGAPLV